MSWLPIVKMHTWWWGVIAKVNYYYMGAYGSLGTLADTNKLIECTHTHACHTNKRHNMIFSQLQMFTYKSHNLKIKPPAQRLMKQTHQQKNIQNTYTKNKHSSFSCNKNNKEHRRKACHLKTIHNLSSSHMSPVKIIISYETQATKNNHKQHNPIEKTIIKQ